MTVISGNRLAVQVAKGGTQVEPCAVAWQATVPHEYANAQNAASAGAALMVCGTSDWEGEYTIYGAEPKVFPGDLFTFYGSVDGTNGIYGPAFCTKIAITADIKRNLPITCKVEFKGNGQPTIGACAVSDTSSVVPECSARGLVYPYQTLDAVWWTLEFADDGIEYVTSLTGGWTKRAANGLMSAASILFATDSGAALPAPGTEIGQMKFYVSSSTYWSVDPMRSALVAVSAETAGSRAERVWRSGRRAGEPVTWALQTVASARSAAGSLGAIVAPSGATKWP